MSVRVVLECNDCGRVVDIASADVVGDRDGYVEVKLLVGGLRVPEGWTGPWMVVTAKVDGAECKQRPVVRCPRCSREVLS